MVLNLKNVEASEIARVLSERYTYLCARVKYFEQTGVASRHPEWRDFLIQEKVVIDNIFKKL